VVVICVLHATAVLRHLKLMTAFVVKNLLEEQENIKKKIDLKIKIFRYIY
jgi:hypothetical protein